MSSVCVRGGSQRLSPQLATIVRSIAHPTYALLPSFRRIGEQDAQGGENATRILAVDGHAEPIARFFLAHGFDAFGDEAHVVAIAHRRECSEQQRQAQRDIFGQRRSHTFDWQEIEADATLLQALQNTMLGQFEIAPAQAR